MSGGTLRTYGRTGDVELDDCDEPRDVEPPVLLTLVRSGGGMNSSGEDAVDAEAADVEAAVTDVVHEEEGTIIERCRPAFFLDNSILRAAFKAHSNSSRALKTKELSL